VNARVLTAQVSDADDCGAKHEELRGQRSEVRDQRRMFESKFRFDDTANSIA